MNWEEIDVSEIDPEHSPAVTVSLLSVENKSANRLMRQASRQKNQVRWVQGASKKIAGKSDGLANAITDLRIAYGEVGLTDAFFSGLMAGHRLLELQARHRRSELPKITDTTSTRHIAALLATMEEPVAYLDERFDYAARTNPGYVVGIESYAIKFGALYSEGQADEFFFGAAAIHDLFLYEARMLDLAKDYQSRTN